MKASGRSVEWRRFNLMIIFSDLIFSVFICLNATRKVWRKCGSLLADEVVQPIKAVLRMLLAWVFTLYYSTSVVVLTALGRGDAAWKWGAKNWAQWAAWALGARIETHNFAAINKPVIFAMNHTGMLDLVVAPWALPRATKVVAKRQLARVPFFGWSLRHGCILIERKRGAEALAKMQAALHDLGEEWSMLIFPEGTRSQDGKLQPLKRGVVQLAIDSGLDVVPIGVSGVFEASPHGQWFPRSAKIVVVAGEPIDTQEWTTEQTEQKLAQISDRMLVLGQQAAELRNQALS